MSNIGLSLAWKVSKSGILKYYLIITAKYNDDKYVEALLLNVSTYLNRKPQIMHIFDILIKNSFIQIT